MNKVDIGVVVGRFQVSDLSDGHLALLRYAAYTSNELIIVLGVSPTPPTVRNPLDFNTRKAMLEKHCTPSRLGFSSDKVKLLIVPHTDRKSDDEWSTALDNLIRALRPTGTVALFGGRDCFKPHYKGKFPVIDIPTKECPSGTEIRTTDSVHVLDSADFRAGATYTAHQHFPRAFPTVDILCYRPSQAIPAGIDILLIRKDKVSKWQLPGGFADPTDTSYEQTARRELHEETGVDIDGMEHVTTMQIDDWRYRNVPDKIITTLYAAPFQSGFAQAADDVADGEAKWFALSTGQHETTLLQNVAEVHYELVQRGILFLRRKGIGDVSFKGEATRG